MKAKLLINGKELEVEISEDDLKKLKTEKTGYERVEHGEYYYYQERAGELGYNFENEIPLDEETYNAANYYSSKEVAERNARADTLMRQLRRFAAEHKTKNRDIDDGKYVILWRNEHIYPLLISDRICGMVWFESREDCDLAIKTFNDELEWYFTEYMPRGYCI